METVQGPAPEEIHSGFQKINLTEDLSDRDMQFLREHHEGMGKLSTLVEHDGRLNGVFTIYPGGDFDHGGMAW